MILLGFESIQLLREPAGGPCVEISLHTYQCLEHTIDHFEFQRIRVLENYSDPLKSQLSGLHSGQLAGTKSRSQAKDSSI